METTVAQRIKSILNDNQINIAAFAKMIGMLQVTCNRQIRGDQAVSLAMIEGFLQWMFFCRQVYRYHLGKKIQKYTSG